MRMYCQQVQDLFAIPLPNHPITAPSIRKVWRRLATFAVLIGSIWLLGGAGLQPATLHAQSDPTAPVQYIYVGSASPNSADATIWVHEPVTLKMVKTIDLGSDNVFKVRVAPNGKRVYVPHPQGITVIDAATNEAIDFLQLPYRSSLLLASDSRTAYMHHNNWVEILDLTTNTITEQIDIGVHPVATYYDEKLALSPNEDILYVGLWRTSEVVVVDLTSKAVAARIALPVGVDELVIATDGAQLYVLGRDFSIYVIDLATNTMSDTIVPDTGVFYQQIDIAPDGTSL